MFQDYHPRCELAGDVLRADDALTAMYAQLNQDAKFMALQAAAEERGNATGPLHGDRPKRATRQR